MIQKTCLEIPELVNSSTTPVAPGFYEHIFKVYTTQNGDKQFYFYNITNKIQLPELDPDFFTEYTPSGKMPFTSFANLIYNTDRSVNNKFILWWLIKLFNPDKANRFFVDPNDTYIVLKPEYVDEVINTITRDG
jgi:hypothetical protein